MSPESCPSDQDNDPGSKISFQQWDYLAHYSPTLRAVYIEVPKAGCTTIKRVLQTAEALATKTTPPVNVHAKSDSPLLSPTSPGIDFDVLLSQDDVFKFSFVRNPFTRVLSAYLDKLVNNDWERNRRLPQLGLRRDDRPSFQEFLRIIAEQEPTQMDIHWMPQTTILDLGSRSYTRVYRFEQFRERLVDVCNYLEVPDEAKLSVHSLPPHATFAADHIREHYSAAETGLIKAIYERDFERLGYSPDLSRVLLR